MSCRREPGRGLTSGFEAPAVSSRSIIQEGFVFPRIVGHPIESPSCSLSGPRFFRASSFTESEVCSADIPGSSSDIHVPSGSQPAPYNSGVGFCGPFAPSLERRGSLHTSHSVAQAGILSTVGGQGPTELGGPCLASAEAGHSVPVNRNLNSAKLFFDPPESRAHGSAPPAKSANHKSKLISRGPIERFLEQHGSSFQRTVSGWQGMLNLSAYKALHPTWNQEPDLLHLAEGLEEHCQEGTLEHWALGKALEASEAQDHTPETWARIARASEDLVHSVSRGKPRAFKFVSANVTSWRPEIRQWLVSQQFDVALIQEHHLSEKSFHAESVALCSWPACPNPQEGDRWCDDLC